MKITGLLVARDEVDLVGLAIESAKDVIDELVFVDHASKDDTGEAVISACDEHDIPLRLTAAPATDSLWECREMAHRKAIADGCDWTFTVDADMWFVNTTTIRTLAEKGEYDAYWFRTLNFSMDLDHISGLNPPHVWLIRASDKVGFGANYLVPQNHFRSDPDRERFIGYNMTYLKSIDHIFWRRHIPGQRAYNKTHDCNISLDEYLSLIYDEPPDDEYKRQFVLGIFQEPDDWELDEARYGKRSWALARPAEYDVTKYGPVPKELTESVAGKYKMLFDNSGQCIGREPDLLP
jgi:glycosyltransferase involved in cell wall biosynthesis